MADTFTVNEPKPGNIILTIINVNLPVGVSNSLEHTTIVVF
jgi:hypothetical protein